MTLEEAHVFLGVHTDRNPEEAYQQQLFEAKHYFTTRPVIRPTFESKLKKLENVQLAAETLGIKKNDACVSNFSFQPSASILATFNEYQTVKNNLLLLIHQSSSFQELISQVNNLLDLQTIYNSCWIDAWENKETVILSKEADPMNFYNVLNELKNNGIVTFENLASNLTTINELIRKESTRLFLLNQREKNG